MSDLVNHPPHYTSHPSGVEIIELTRLLPFSAGNAVKYVMRRDAKGSPVQDLDKALWYLRDARDNSPWHPLDLKMARTVNPVIAAEPDATVKQFLAAMYLRSPRTPWSELCVTDFDLAIELVQALREEYAPQKETLL